MRSIILLLKLKFLIIDTKENIIIAINDADQTYLKKPFFLIFSKRVFGAMGPHRPVAVWYENIINM